MLIEDCGYEVEYPRDGATADDPNNAYDEKEAIMLHSALDDTVDSPHDIENGNAEDKLNYPRKVVYELDEIFHSISPFVFCYNLRNYRIIILPYLFGIFKTVCAKFFKKCVCKV